VSVSRQIVISGVSQGLGQAMTEGFIANGHIVNGCSRQAAAIESLRTRFGKPHRFDVVDVADAKEVEAWASTLAERSPDLLINNAAIINRNAPLWEVPVEEFGKVIDINVKGTFHLLRSFLPIMVARGCGIVVNFSSTWGSSTSPKVAPYCASKWAIEGLTRALSQELPRGMAAIALNPGIIHTKMLESCFGSTAGAFPDPAAWAVLAVPWLLSLSAADNGKSLRVPEAPR